MEPYILCIIRLIFSNKPPLKNTQEKTNNLRNSTLFIGSSFELTFSFHYQVFSNENSDIMKQ